MITKEIKTKLSKLGSKDLEKRVKGGKMDELHLQIANEILASRQAKAKGKKEVVKVTKTKSKTKKVVNEKAVNKTKSVKKQSRKESSLTDTLSKEQKAELRIQKLAEKNRSARFKKGETVEFMPSRNSTKHDRNKPLVGEIIHIRMVEKYPHDMFMAIRLESGDVVHKLGSACKKH